MGKSISLTTPTGTYGLAVEPWSAGEIYGVAANWAQASAPVYTYGRNGWTPNGRQVADYRHEPAAALADEITAAIAASDGVPSDEVDADEVNAIVSDATEVTDEGETTDEE